MLLLLFNQPTSADVEAAISQTLPVLMSTLQLDMGREFGGGVAPRPTRMFRISQTLPVVHQLMLVDVGDDDLAMMALIDMVEVR